MSIESAASQFDLWRSRPDVFVEQVFGVTPDSWQREILQAFPHNQRIAMKASKGVGKLQPKSLLIDTPSGKTKWGDLMVGDEVFAEDGSITRIKNIYENGVVEQYKVTFDDGSSSLCGGEHLWKVRGVTERRHSKTQPLMNERQRNISKGQREWNPRMDNDGWVVLTTEEIIRRGVRVKNGKWAGRQFEIPMHGAAQYRHGKELIDPYVVGVWIGDGAKNTGRYTGIDKEVEDEIRSRGYEVKNTGKYAHVIYGIVPELRQLGLLNLNSYDRYIPDVCKYASIQQRMNLLSGLMDTDGCIGKDNGSMEFDTTSKKLAEDVVWLVRSLGGKSFIRDKIQKTFYYGKNKEKIKGRDCYRVTLRLSFCPFKIKRKAVRWRPADNKSKQRYLTRYIDRIERLDAEDSMCIEICHPSKCYLTNDFIVTHNSCVEAWLAWNFLLTRPYPKIAATSITGANLADGLWSEMAVWQKKTPLLMDNFTFTKTRIFLNKAPETWWMSARPWSKTADTNEQGNTLAGLHADYIMFILDESGGIPEAVAASAEAALSSCVEGHILQAGNPTSMDGMLYKACTRDRKLWYVREITSDPDNPMRSSRVNIEWARNQITMYGRDNPFVLVNVFGEFPPAAFNALIGKDEVEESFRKNYHDTDYGHAAKVLGVDVARGGADSSIIFPRQGLQAFTPMVYRNINGTEGANLVARKWRDWGADVTFIDDTGGFGSSWIDNLQRLGYSPIGIHFNSKSANVRYVNKRTEMIFECIEWIKQGGSLPNIPELTSALTETTYTFKGDSLIIEPKELIKARLGYSPDHLDALALSFAQPALRHAGYAGITGIHTSAYDPFSRSRMAQDIGGSKENNHQSVWSPDFRRLT